MLIKISSPKSAKWMSSANGKYSPNHNKSVSVIIVRTRWSQHSMTIRVVEWDNAEAPLPDKDAILIHRDYTIRILVCLEYIVWPWVTRKPKRNSQHAWSRCYVRAPFPEWVNSEAVTWMEMDRINHSKSLASICNTGTSVSWHRFKSSETYTINVRIVNHASGANGRFSNTVMWIIKPTQ